MKWPCRPENGPTMVRGVDNHPSNRRSCFESASRAGNPEVKGAGKALTLKDSSAGPHHGFRASDAQYNVPEHQAAAGVTRSPATWSLGAPLPEGRRPQ